MLKRFLVAFFLLSVTISWAQEGTISPYSFYGIGIQKFKGTIENRTMAGLSVYSDSIHLNVLNPAGLADLELVNYTIAASHKYETLKTDAQKERASTTSIDYLALGIPMGKFGAGFGVLPATAVGYNLQTQVDAVTQTYEGSGGLNQVFFSLGYQLLPGLNIGALASYNFGNIDNNLSRVEENIQYGTAEFNTSDLLGFSYTLGVQYKRLLANGLQLTAAANYTPSTKLTSENSRTIESFFVLPSGSTTPRDTREIPVEDTDFTFPSQLTTGFGVGRSKKWFVGAEYTSQKSSNLTNRTFDVDFVTFNDDNTFRLGGFFIPNYNAISNYWKRVVYRAGVRFEETGINIRGQDVNEFGISFGVGLPVGRLFSSINIGFEFGRRGTTNNGLVQENFFNTFVSLSLNDRWFKKRYYD
jgi:hypothetical protein